MKAICSAALDHAELTLKQNKNKHNRKMKLNSEDYLQIYLVSFLKKLQLSGADFMFWCVPNGGSRNKAEAGKLKLMGVTAGIPDLCFMGHDKVFFIELKVGKNKTSKEQNEFIQKSKDYNFQTYVVHAENVPDILNQCTAILMKEFNIDHHAISKSSSAVISSLTKSGSTRL